MRVVELVHAILGVCCVYDYIRMQVSSKAKKTNACSGASPRAGSDRTAASEGCDGCQSNARGRKGSERRQTQT